MAIAKLGGGEKNAGEEWTEAEVDLIVADYFSMLQSEFVGRNYSKTEHRDRLLARLGGRSKGSVEFKHANISAVLVDLGCRTIKGYKPRGNYQGLLRQRVVAYLQARPRTDALAPVRRVNAGFDAFAAENEIERHARTPARRRKLPEREADEPPGASTSAPRETTRKDYERRQEVIDWVLRKSGGRCDCCGRKPPFERVDGGYGLEVHHVKTLAEKGPDQPDNAVAVCPNCHRALHEANDRAERIERLYKRVQRLRRY